MGLIRTKWPEALKANLLYTRKLCVCVWKSVEWDSFLLGGL